LNLARAIFPAPRGGVVHFSFKRIFSRGNCAKVFKRQVELAWCYADIFFNDWPKPFPWGLGRRFWQDLKEWPITRMLSPEGENKFGKTLCDLIGE